MKYNISEIMRMGHKIARDIRERFESYKAALSHALKEAWKIAKGVITWVEPQKATEVPLRPSDGHLLDGVERLIDERLVLVV